MRYYVIGCSKDGRGARVSWSQMAKDEADAIRIKAAWENAGIENVIIIKHLQSEV